MDRLDDDTAVHVLEFLEAAVDLAHVSLVSRSWRQFVLEGRLWRRLCLKEYPELERVEKIGEASTLRSNFGSNSGSSSGSGSEKFSSDDEAGSVSNQSFQDVIEKEHRIFCLLHFELSGQPLLKRSCLKEAIAASSTDNWPQESIQKTLYPGSQEPSDGPGWSYWSSTGQAEDVVPETLTYKLLSSVCVVHEIKLRPFQAEFQHGTPVYSPKSVKFRLGFQRQVGPSVENGSTSGEYAWTYESPEYPVEQEDTLQSFKLPRPVLCMGQILQIELLGRMQTQQSDLLYYICVCHVSVTGRPIPSFNFRDVGDLGGNVLIYSGRTTDESNSWDGLDPVSFAGKEDAGDQAFGWSSFTRRVRQLRWNNRLFSLGRRDEI